MSTRKQHSTASKKHSKKIPADPDQKDPSGSLSLSLYPNLTDWLIGALKHGDPSLVISEALELVSTQIDCALVEINLFDESRGFFIPSRSAHKKVKSFVQKQALDRYPVGEGYTGWLAEHRSLLHIPDTQKRPDAPPSTDLKTFPFNSYLGVPLLWEDHLLGTLELVRTTAGPFSSSDIATLTAIANLLSAALNMVGLQQKVNYFARIQEASNLISGFGDRLNDTPFLWEGLSRALVDPLELSMLGIFLRSDEDDMHQLHTPYLCRKQGQNLKCSPASIISPPGSDLAALWLHQEYWYTNLLEQEQLERLLLGEILKPLKVGKLLIIPLLAGGERFGFMLAGRADTAKDFIDGEASSLQAIGRQLGTMMHASRALSGPSASPTPVASGKTVEALQVAQAAIQPERMSELLRLSAELTSSLDLDRSLRRVLKVCNDLMMADLAVFMTINDSHGEIALRQVMPELETHGSLQRVDLEEVSRSISQWVISHQQPLVISDLTQDDRWAFKDFHSVCAVVCATDTDISGILLFFAKAVDVFGQDDVQIARIVARQMASALNNSYLYSVIREQADRLGLMLRSQQIETSQSNAILESIADGVIVTDTDHNVILYNDAAERILNLPIALILGKQVFDHIGIFGSKTIQWGETLRQWKSTPPDQHQRQVVPERMVLEDGRIISILPAPVVLGGDFLGTVSIFRDISREVEVDRLKSEFVATVSHELRTPMTSIKGFVDVMLMGVAGELTDQQRHFLDIVRTNTNRLEILVNDLLDISRIEAGKASLVFQELDVPQLFSEMEQYIEHRSLEEKKKMQFSYESAKGLPPIWGDLERVRQILANIVENSFNYTPEDGLIELRARNVDDHIEIEVEDNGMGISLEEQERIFERFYRGEQALIMGVSGTGLGLAIVLHLVEMHHGRIWVNSEGAGKGTTFTVSLPTASNQTP